MTERTLFYDYMQCARRNLNEETGDSDFTVVPVKDDTEQIDEYIDVDYNTYQELTENIEKLQEYIKGSLYNTISNNGINNLFIEDVDTFVEIQDEEISTQGNLRKLPWYEGSTTCSDTARAIGTEYYTYYYYAGVNYYYYYCCPSGGTVSGSSCYYYYGASCSYYYCCPSGGTVSGASCYYYYGATPVTYGKYECRSGGSLQTDGVTCLRNNC
jgi:hypothetical protein